MQVTRHTTQGRGTALRCWARGFYPQEISLSWWLGEEELGLEAEHMETRPSGDGTYQTWAAVWVQAGEEAGYTCRVQHSGLNHTLTVAWGEELGVAGGGHEGREGPRPSEIDPWSWGCLLFSTYLRTAPSSRSHCHGYLRYPYPGAGAGGWSCDLHQDVPSR